MPNRIIPKKSSVAAKVPLATDLSVGEIAINLVDKKIYSKDSGGTVVELAGASGAVTSFNTRTGAVTLTSSDVTTALGTTPSFDQVFATNNGNGTNFKVGDDAWIGDINTANTIRITGLQDATKGYIVFGNSDATALGRSGTGALTYGAATVLTSTTSAATFPTLNQNTTGSSASCTGNAATATTATNLSGGTVSATTGTFSGVLTPTGGIVNGAMFNNVGAAGEGGELRLQKGATSTLSADVSFDLYNQSIRFFENGGTSRGAYLDISAQSASVGSLILTSTTSAASFPTLNQNTTGTAGNVSGTVALANGGTGSTTAAGARTNLGATTVGANLFTLTNPSAITFPRINADNTVSALDAATFRTAIGAGTSSTTGTVTSVSGTGTASGLTLSGTVTSSGSLTLSGTVNALAAGTYAISISGNAATATTATTATNQSGGTVSATTGTFSGITSITNTTASTTSSNGALVVSGGVGIAGRTTVNDIINRITGNGNSAWLQQDGTGRTHWYWNTYGGTTPTFTTAGEDAIAISMTAGNGGNGGQFFTRTASGVGKLAGDAISWTTVLFADLGSFTYKGNAVLRSDNYNSYAPTLTGTGASGTWGISISGSAATLTTARTLTIGSTGKTFNGSANVSWTVGEIGAYPVNGSAATDLNTVGQGLWRINTGHTNQPTGTDYGTLLSFDNSSDTGFQLASDFASNNFYWRSGNASVYGGTGSFGSWRKLIHDGNYNSYAPTLTGTGASGTWGISISGNAATATNADTLDGNHAAAFALLSGATFTGGLKEAKVAMAANDVNLNSGNYFTKTISGATTLTVSNVPATGTVAAFVLDLTNGGSGTITWWSGMKWVAGTAPTLTTSGRDVLAFFTHDGGTTWSGFVLGKDVK